MVTPFPTRTTFWKAAFRNSRTNSRRPSPRKAMKRPRDGTKRSGGNRSPRNMKPSEPHLTLRNTATRAATGRPDPLARRQPHAGAPLFPRTPAAPRGFPRHIASPLPSRPGRRSACRLRGQPSQPARFHECPPVGLPACMGRFSTSFSFWSGYKNK